MRPRPILLGAMPALVLAPIVSAAAADVIHVPADQPTIQAAIIAAAAGDEIVVADGVYSGPGNRDMKFSGKPLTLRSANGPQRCIIDCQFTGRAFTFGALDASLAVLDGLTIRNGLAPTTIGGTPRQTRGGAILCVGGSPTIRRCMFESNHAYEGGAIALRGGLAQFTDCVFLGNEATVGGAIGFDYFTNSRPFVRCRFEGNHAYGGGAISMNMGDYQNVTVFRDCVFRANEADDYGGAIYGWFNNQISMLNCLLADNRAGVGGAAISYTESTLHCINCTLAGNSGPPSAGTIAMIGTAQTDMKNSILWGNSAGSMSAAPYFYPPAILYVTASYSAIQDPYVTWIGAGCIGADPRFFNPAAGDYRLLPDSPCIDTGTNALVPLDVTTDLVGNPRIVDGDGDGTAVVDMGAYEFQPTPLVTGDLSGDGVVNSLDLGILLSSWSIPRTAPGCGGAPGPCPADVNHDGVVDSLDLGILLSGWTL